MPYINQKTRKTLDKKINELLKVITTGDYDSLDGTINYTLTRIAAGAFKGDGWRYKRIKDVIAAFECAKLEFYRRVACDYEDEKIKENGDVSEYKPDATVNHSQSTR